MTVPAAGFEIETSLWIDAAASDGMKVMKSDDNWWSLFPLENGRPVKEGVPPVEMDDICFCGCCGDITVIPTKRVKMNLGAIPQFPRAALPRAIDGP